MESIFLPVENSAIGVKSRYQLAILAAQRARQLMEGDKPTCSSRFVKPTTIAMEEILSGALKIFHGKEAQRYQDEALRARKERKERFLSPEREEELRKEIKKDLSVYLADVEKGPYPKEDQATHDTANES